MYTEREVDCGDFRVKLNDFVSWTRDFFRSLAQSFEEKMEEIDDMVSDMFSSSSASTEDDSFEPKYDVISFDDSFYIHIESPGIILDDIQMTSKTNEVNFYISKKQKATVSPHTMIENNRKYGIYKLHLVLPHPVMANKINVEYNDGVICAIIPKKHDITDLHSNDKLINDNDSGSGSDDFEIIIEKLNEHDV
jgi:HSP20 family molecular chaperone IbpA